MSDDKWKESELEASSVPGAPEQASQWRVIDNLVSGIVKEQRRGRRWGIFFKSLTFIYVAVLFVAFTFNSDPASLSAEGEHTALIEVRGVIAEGEAASADNLVSSLRAAYENEATQALILRINSPGGSPVQSGYVFDEIRRLRSLYPHIPVYAVISDIGASGAYYIAAAADHIYANKASLVGSIGVVASGFGFVDAMEKLGVDRRLYTSGEHKGFLDPFQEQKDSEVEFWQSVLDTTHKQFIASVKLGRGERLQSHPDLFSGLVWSGEQAKELGLVDGLGSSSYVARELIGVEEIVDFTQQDSPLERFAKSIGASFSQALVAQFGLGSSPLR